MDLNEIKKKLNDIGPGFCLAKWEQVTLHLHNGTAHSCYHPPVHKIPLHELKNNPSAIHNTQYKKLQRKMMLEGNRPPECSFCWNIEDSSEECYSDRIYKSATIAPENFEKIKNSDWKEDYNPAYVEISFSHLCNMACCYCSPIVSSRYMEEIKRYGPYDIFIDGYPNVLHEIKGYGDKTPIDKDQHNPYVEAFWKWFPQLYKTLKNFRITGGEPLINKNTYLVLDKILENPKEGLELSINSNLSIPDSYFTIFLKYLDKIQNSVFKDNFILYTSLESTGKQAEYVRYGLNFEKWVNNINNLLDNFDIKISIMCTYNALSVSSFLEFLKLVKQFKLKNPGKFFIDIPYLEIPKFMSVLVLDEEFFIPKLNEQIEFVCNDDLFNESEKNRIKQIYDFYNHFHNNLNEQELKDLKKSFYSFFKEYDKRRNLNFLEIFPEYENFWKQCGVL